MKALGPGVSPTRPAGLALVLPGSAAGEWSQAGSSHGGMQPVASGP